MLLSLIAREVMAYINYMKLSYKTSKDINSREEFVDYYLEAIDYRNKNKSELSSDELALRVFNDIHQGELSFTLGDDLERIRDEMGALSAPGAPDEDDVDYGEYEDRLWSELRAMVVSTRDAERLGIPRAKGAGRGRDRLEAKPFYDDSGPVSGSDCTIGCVGRLS